MKFGIIGAGNHAQKRVMPAIVRTGHEVSAIYSRDIEKAKKIGLKYLSKPYNDMGTFLTGDFDAVYISSPNFLHYEHAMASLKRGKHVLLEKQMTLKNEQAAELVKEAEKQKLVLSIGFHMRFHPAVIKAKELVSGGKVGKVVYASGMWSGSSSGRHIEPDRKWWDEEDKSGGGSVMGTGVHVIDTLNYVLGKGPVRVTSSRVPRKAVIDVTESVTMYYGEEIATAISSREMKHPRNDLEILGTEGTVFAENIFGTDVKGSLTLNGDEVESYSKGDMYDEEIKAFLSEMRGDRTRIAEGKDGATVVRIVNAAFEADYMGKWVDL